MRKPRDMTAFCKVTVVAAAPVPNLPPPATREKPPPAPREKPPGPREKPPGPREKPPGPREKPPARPRARGRPAAARPAAPRAKAAEQPGPVPYEPEGLEFSRLDGEEEDGPDSGPEWEDEEEVHEDLGDQGSHDYPSEDDLPLPADPLPAAPPPPRPPPAPVQYAGRCLELEEEVF